MFSNWPSYLFFSCALRDPRICLSDCSFRHFKCGDISYTHFCFFFFVKDKNIAVNLKVSFLLSTCAVPAVGVIRSKMSWQEHVHTVCERPPCHSPGPAPRSFQKGDHFPLLFHKMWDLINISTCFCFGFEFCCLLWSRQVSWNMNQ